MNFNINNHNNVSSQIKIEQPKVEAEQKEKRFVTTIYEVNVTFEEPEN